MAAPTCSVCELHAESTFKIEGMDCREEVAILERRFKNLKGVEDFSADLMGQRLHVKYDAAKLSAARIADAVADTGMRAWLEHEEPIGTDRRTGPQMWLVYVSALALGGALMTAWVDPQSVLARVLAAVSLATGLGATLRRAWTAVRLRSVDINVLMLIAAAGAIAIDQWLEAATVIFLFAIAQILEARTVERARTA